jgi:hypothetical protein
MPDLSIIIVSLRHDNIKALVTCRVLTALPMRFGRVIRSGQ